MDNNQDKFVIQLLIGKQLYPITVKREQEGMYRKAAQLIKAEYLAGRREKTAASGSLTLSQAIDRYISSRENVRYTSVALLDFAVQMLQLQEQKDESLYTETVGRLSAEIDALLKAGKEEAANEA